MFGSMGEICNTMHRGGSLQGTAIPQSAALRGASASRVNDCWHLPRLSPKIPHHILSGTIRKENAGIAKFLLDAGVVHSADIPPTWTDELAVCQAAFNRWLLRELGPLRCFRPRFILRQDSTRNLYFPSSESRGDPIDLEIVWFEDEASAWVVGPGLERVEVAAPGLGEKVLQVLMQRSDAVYPIFSPADALGAAMYLHWYGEEDETMALDENCGDDEAARAEMLQDMVTKADFAASFPAWAMKYPRKRIAASELEVAVQGCRDRFANEVVALARELASMRIKNDSRPDYDAEFVGHGALLVWDDNDITGRVYDDLKNSAMEGEYCDLIGEMHFRLDNPRALEHWMRRMRRRFKAMRLIDSLIFLLSEGH